MSVHSKGEKYKLCEWAILSLLSLQEKWVILADVAPIGKPSSVCVSKGPDRLLSKLLYTVFLEQTHFNQLHYTSAHKYTT